MCLRFAIWDKIDKAEPGMNFSTPVLYIVSKLMVAQLSPSRTILTDIRLLLVTSRVGPLPLTRLRGDPRPLEEHVTTAHDLVIRVLCSEDVAFCEV